ncbi:antitoxin [Ruania alba]|uniref:MT0933-like antitoxin protein n=1 Tax=Ruania alba TaxID=648782 RepID=A0A1H5KHG5_9MICO|nr:antitoxin [Ruania alba]SEE64064.1 MT0933-like antitoxin protein [Ruania alba]
MVGFDDIKNKASEALKNEEQTDQGLDAAANFADEKTGGQHSEHIDKGRDFLDGKLGEN